MNDVQLQHIKLEKLGPVDYCEMDVYPMMVLTGAQGTGKSTIAVSHYERTAFCFFTGIWLNVGDEQRV